MFGLIRKLVGGSPEPIPTPPPRRNGQARTVAYDAALVASLTQDHHDLVHLFQRIGRLAESGDHMAIPSLLVSFKTRLESHLIAENVRFYNYVENTLRDDAENLALIRSFRREMNAIARGVVDFVKKYQISRFSEDDRRAFLDDYQAVGRLLAERIEREEHSLYPLYQPD